MEEEFKRFGLPNISLFIAFSQLSGSFGLIFGFFYPIFLIISSAGLTTMMLIACLVRFRVKDTLLESLPALFYLVLNTVILIYSHNLI
jgi:hypothetical protein